MLFGHIDVPCRPPAVRTRTRKPPPVNPIALIGAGPSGLAGARALSRAGLPFHGFEAGADVGGLWNIDNPRSTMYESAHLISSRTTTEFAEFPMRSTADYPGHRELLGYFREYADEFGLREHFRFETRVTAIDPLPDLFVRSAE